MEMLKKMWLVGLIIHTIEMPWPPFYKGFNVIRITMVKWMNSSNAQLTKLTNRSINSDWINVKLQTAFIGRCFYFVFCLCATSALPCCLLYSGTTKITGGWFDRSFRSGGGLKTSWDPEQARVIGTFRSIPSFYKFLSFSFFLFILLLPHTCRRAHTVQECTHRFKCLATCDSFKISTWGKWNLFQVIGDLSSWRLLQF